jgi:hypothetical protein
MSASKPPAAARRITQAVGIAAAALVVGAGAAFVSNADDGAPTASGLTIPLPQFTPRPLLPRPLAVVPEPPVVIPTTPTPPVDPTPTPTPTPLVDPTPTPTPTVVPVPTPTPTASPVFPAFANPTPAVGCAWWLGGPQRGGGTSGPGGFGGAVGTGG